jgi:hypothetical protein
VTTYTNISEEWGLRLSGLTVDDYTAQARAFGEDPDSLTADSDGVYFDGIQIAVVDER